MQDKTPINKKGERNKTPINKKGQAHGLWVCYCNYNSVRVIYKGMYINDIQLGFWVEEMNQFYYAK
jgi:hypothetical protein